MLFQESQSPGSGEETEAVVKWYSSVKGFGFVAPSNGKPDAFMHMSVVTRAGLHAEQVQEGTKIRIELGQGAKGPQVLQILEVLGMAEGGGDSGPSFGFGNPGGGGGRPAPTGPAQELFGTVKWFKTDKGFGFVSPDDGGRDVFIHKSVVTRLGLHQLDPGQRLRMQVHTTNKGREAVSAELA